MSLPDANGVSLRLDGQVALVTGGGRGLGRTVALGLAAAGAATAVAARSADELAQTVELIEAAGGVALAVRADVTNWRSIEAAVTEVGAKLGPIDVLASIAGTYGEAGPSWECDPDAWSAILDSNLRGRFLSARAVLPGMVAKGRGRIINMGSHGGTIAGPFTSAYSSAYAGLLRLGESLAAELKEHGVSVFTISPGFTITPGAERSFPSWKAWVPPMAGLLESGYSTPPDATAALVTWLAAGEGDGLSGRYVSVTDDYRAMAARSTAIQEQDAYVLRLRTERVP
jgi:3-oxoacyl-[acyl-carrier protein] reductase